MGAIESCGPECGDLSLFVEIRDPDAVNEATSPGFCFSKYQETAVCDVRTEHVGAQRRAPIDSTCAAGSGRFRLIPVAAEDGDADGAKSISFRPIQMTGSGAMTAAAWITSVAPAQTRGRPIRAVKVNRNYRFSTSDILDNPSIVSMPLPLSTTTTFQTGVIAGNAPFVSEEVPTNTYLDWTVDLAWSCAAATEMEDVAPPQGYTFTLAQLGCPGSLPQKFVVRPDSATSPTRMSVSIYGSVSDPVWVDLTSTSTGYAFAFSEASLALTGRLISISPNTGAIVAVDSASWGATAVCTPGSYTLTIEQ